MKFTLLKDGKSSYGNLYSANIEISSLNLHQNWAESSMNPIAGRNMYFGVAFKVMKRNSLSKLRKQSNLIFLA